MLADTLAYYRGAIWALKFVEGRRPSGRRFGAEADALWKGFGGELSASHRIDLLVRDADAQWSGAFGARGVFALAGVAEDEPFGPDWQPLDGVDAEELWRSLAKEPAPSSVTEALGRLAAAWALPLPSFAAPPVAAHDRLVVAGPAAIAALIGAFATTAGLDWAEQVTCIATPPAHRALALAAGALLNLTKPTRLRTASADAKGSPGAKLLLSPDAAPPDATRARELVP